STSASIVVHIPHATLYVVGDLSREEAEEYFEKHVLPRYDMSSWTHVFMRTEGSHNIYYSKKNAMNSKANLTASAE
ncbi:3477_t:CDS:1, partial [Ambispora leptoticha]